MNGLFKTNSYVRHTLGHRQVLEATIELTFHSVLDIGPGDGAAVDYFLNKKKKVTAIGLNMESYGFNIKSYVKKGATVIERDFFDASPLESTYDLIWASHVMEHLTNPGLFLKKVNSLMNEKSWLCVMVPPYKERIVGGHVSTGWNLGQLMYVLIIQGFDVRNGHFAWIDHNVIGFVKKRKSELPKGLFFDKGDVEKLENYFPDGLSLAQNSWGRLHRVNWITEMSTFEKLSKLKRELIETISKIIFLPKRLLEIFIS